MTTIPPLKFLLRCTSINFTLNVAFQQCEAQLRQVLTSFAPIQNCYCPWIYATILSTTHLLLHETLFD